MNKLPLNLRATAAISNIVKTFYLEMMCAVIELFGLPPNCNGPLPEVQISISFSGLYQ